MKRLMVGKDVFRHIHICQQRDSIIEEVSIYIQPLKYECIINH